MALNDVVLVHIDLGEALTGRNYPLSLRLSRSLLGIIEARMRSIDLDLTSIYYE